ncbi:MAG TPA: tetratricopeptide repeat protein [Devosiaceae bacterium]
MPSLFRALPGLAVIGLVTLDLVLPAAAASTPVAAMSTADLMRQCAEGNVETPERFDVDATAILQRHDQGVAACNRLIDSNLVEGHDLAEALLDRADLAMAGPQGYAGALVDYARAITLVPDSAAAYWRRGKANLLYERDLSAALGDLDEAIRLAPSEAEFLVTRASILGWLGRPDPALADLNHALSVDPRNVHALSNRGLAYFNKGDTTQALADFDAALALAPDDPGLYGFRSAARHSAGDEAGAKADDARMTALMYGTVK